MKQKDLGMVIFLIIVQILQSLDCRKVNLAFKRRAYLSSVHSDHFAWYAVNGIVSEKQYAEASNTNVERWLTIDLARPYQVSHVHLHYKSECNDCDDIPNVVSIGLSNHFDVKVKPSEICVFASVDTFICSNKEAYYRYVIIKPVFPSKYLAIKEIEIIGEYINYLGCFKSIIGNKTIASNYNLTACINDCEAENFYFAAMQETTCICGNKTKHYLSLSECNVMCSGDVDYCGGSNKLSVYQVFPLKFLKNIVYEYVGCFTSTNKDMIHKTVRILEECQNYCAIQNSLFFAIQKGNKCLCSSIVYNFHEVEDNLCNIPCDENLTSLSCGGINTSSIYSITSKYGGSSYFRKNHQCKNGTDLDTDGLCRNGQCEDGWTGEDCTIRDCSTNNGDCGEHECLTTYGKTTNFSECTCKRGFDKEFWRDYCRDRNIEKEKAINCSDTETKYQCKCLKEPELIHNNKCKGLIVKIIFN